ncbi:integrator complex subunit 11 [Dendrobium catenatum]|uniref:Integrator complex subunit 11 n=1 Tax=Dendrobium catenatum TaxID=906689 RepID=A0A2I0X6B5_9ASPA|nr:integrator complex subunit 11 [Dendrobium catenatum]
MEAMEGVLSGGPWYVRGYIVGLDKWTVDFSPTSLKGLSSPIWVRMPHLPLYCWDDINITCIASMVGTPLFLDGNMFQWSKREFARVCVRVALDKQLPLGILVEGTEGRFFQNLEYEIISSFCFECGKIGHIIEECEIIFEYQYAYVTGRSMSDQIFLAQELFNKFRYSKSKKGMMAIKIDMEQAYDSMSWSTLAQVLDGFGFPKLFSTLILECLREPKFAIMFNGRQSDLIEARSGFRQGCPLSPYMLIMCSQLLTDVFAQRGKNI